MDAGIPAEPEMTKLFERKKKNKHSSSFHHREGANSTKKVNQNVFGNIRAGVGI